MKAVKKAGQFEKVGECLYRYKPSGKYYARIKKNGKEIRQSLETKDRVVARASLAEKRKELKLVRPVRGKNHGGRDRKLAEKCLKEWLENQDKAEKPGSLTFDELLKKHRAITAGRSANSRQNVEWAINPWAKVLRFAP